MTFISDSRTPISVRDREILNEKLANLCSEQEKLVVEVSERRGALDILERQLEYTRNQIAHYKSSLTPIHTLPPELMEGILRATIEDWLLIHSTSFFYNEIRKPKGLPLLPTVVSLSMVCGKWRDLVLSTPSLWSQFEISFSYWDETPIEKLLTGLQLFLGRSRNHPLTFQLHWGGQVNAASLTALSNLVSALVDNSNRWYDVTVGGSTDTTVLRSFERLAGNLRQLKRLELSIDAFPLSRIRHVFGHPNAPILDSVKFFMGSSSHVIYLMSKARHCFVEDVQIKPYDGVVLEGLFLTSLHIAAESAQDLAKVLNYVKLPNLETLELRLWMEGDNMDAFWELSSVVNLFRRSGFNDTHGLRELTLFIVPVLDTELIPVLEAVPTLQSLTVHELNAREEDHGDDEDVGPFDKQNFAITTTFLKRLTRSPNANNDFLPKLKELELSVVWEGLDQQALVDAVTSRKPGTTTVAAQNHLSSVTVHLGSGKEDDCEALAKIEDLSEGGLDVELYYPDDDDSDDERPEES